MTSALSGKEELKGTEFKLLEVQCEVDIVGNDLDFLLQDSLMEMRLFFPGEHTTCTQNYKLLIVFLTLV